jgi:hypothetical protein
MKLSYLPIFFLFLVACIDKRINPGTLIAGYTNIHFTDQSRIYKTGSSDTHYLHYRPIDLDVWYPAEQESADSLLKFKDLLGKLESSSIYYTASTAATGLTGLAKSICDQRNVRFATAPIQDLQLSKCKSHRFKISFGHLSLQL